uniref:Uncharacterized protein n=1 Tax=Vespula pensylvanica TaxID=30213 RepID=A0A834JTV9_VESPE|nr:hypothetical protein H0235_016906 [Vespula pensylvanica]
MKTLLILVGLLLEIHLYFTESHAKHQQESSSKNIVESLNALEGKGDDVLEGPISEVVAQSGGKAVLPCKITDPGAGTWFLAKSSVYFGGKKNEIEDISLKENVGESRHRKYKSIVLSCDILRNSISLHAYDSYFGIAIKGKHQIDISAAELAKARTEGLNVVVSQLTIRPRSSSNPDCYLAFNDIFKIPTKPFCPLDRAVYAITLFTKKPSSLNALQTVNMLQKIYKK